MQEVKLTVVQKTVSGLIAIAALFLVAICGSGFLSYRLADLEKWTVHTHKVIEELKDSLSALQDVETGERGYLVTLSKEFLEPWEWGQSQAMLHIKQVQLLTADNSSEQAAVNKLRQLAQRKIGLSQAGIAAAENESKSMQIARQHDGKRTMDDYRANIKKMVDTENSLLQKRGEDLRITEYACWWFVATLSVSALVLLNWVYRMTQAAIEDEKQRVAQLSSEIAQRKRTEKGLKEATINLCRSNDDLQQFAYVASHDLQEPLRAVTGFLTLLSNRQAGKLDADSQKYINHAVEGGERMRALINDLLVFARVEARAKKFESVELVKVLERVNTNLSVQIAENKAEILAENPPSVIGEPTQLAQLFQNLISNAIKFRGPSAPQVKVTFIPQKTDWLVCVEDNGRGFDMEHAERIFVIFQRLQGREEAAGTGIGLALCKKIVERHGGKIWVESKRDQGSKFFFTLAYLNGATKDNECN
jgi:signal transduction histidine kinase